jgi:sulfopyruvate decarboxylase TPP-binding subunit
MIPGQEMIDALSLAGFTHVVWIPDSHIGTWETAIAASSKIMLIRPCREGEAVAIAAGLMIGSAKPLVMIQCTGLFESGDAIRNVVHDLNLPLKLLVGVRSWRNRNQSSDNCPRFTEPFVRALDLPYSWFDSFESTSTLIDDLNRAIQKLSNSTKAEVLLWAE